MWGGTLVPCFWGEVPPSFLCGLVCGVGVGYGGLAIFCLFESLL